VTVDPAVEILRRDALWFEPTADGLGHLVDAVGDRALVLIGEASHGIPIRHVKEGP
jgi:erythromycin esterase-like protein